MPQNGALLNMNMLKGRDCLLDSVSNIRPQNLILGKLFGMEFG